MILVAGSANLDFVVRAAHIPAPGETVLGRSFQTFPGGKGANQAVACARAGGAATRMLPALGDDAFAPPIGASLRDAGVQLQVVRVAGEPTGTAFICVSDDAENAITVAPGANAQLRPADLPPLDGVTHLLLQLETPLHTVTDYAMRAQAAGVTVMLNAAPARALPAGLLAAVDLLIVNEGELEAIAGVAADLDAALALLAVPSVVVTRGCRDRLHAAMRPGQHPDACRGRRVRARDARPRLSAAWRGRATIRAPQFPAPWQGTRDPRALAAPSA
jgi:ribokinase